MNPFRKNYDPIRSQFCTCLWWHVQNYNLVELWELKLIQTSFSRYINDEHINPLWTIPLIYCRKPLKPGMEVYLWCDSWLADCTSVVTQRDILQLHQPMNDFSSSPGQNGRLFADDIFRRIFVNEKFCISIKISLKIVPKCPIDNNPVLI